MVVAALKLQTVNIVSAFQVSSVVWCNQHLLEASEIFPNTFKLGSILFLLLNVYKIEYRDKIWAVDVVVKHTSNRALDFRFDSRPGQIGHSVANGSPLLRRFFGAVLPKR